MSVFTYNQYFLIYDVNVKGQLSSKTFLCGSLNGLDNCVPTISQIAKRCCCFAWKWSFRLYRMQIEPKKLLTGAFPGVAIPYSFILTLRSHWSSYEHADFTFAFLPFLQYNQSLYSRPEKSEIKVTAFFCIDNDVFTNIYLWNVQSPFHWVLFRRVPPPLILLRVLPPLSRYFRWSRSSISRVLKDVLLKITFL